MPVGLPGATAISRVFVAKERGEPSRSADPSFAMFASSADANTSAGAPFWIWLTRSLEPANANVTVVPGCAASYRSPSVVKVCWSEAAAKTVIEPVGPPDDDAEGPVVPGVPGWVEQPTSARTTAPAVASRGRVRVRVRFRFRRCDVTPRS